MQGLQGLQGPPGAPGTAGQLGQVAFGSGPLTVTPTSAAAVIPGLTTTVTVPATSVVYVSTSGGIQTTSASTNGVSAVDVFLAVDGSLVANGGYARIVAANTDGVTGNIANWSTSQLMTLTAGSHTFTVRAVGVNLAGAVDATVSGNNTSPNQGTINVMVLRL